MIVLETKRLRLRWQSNEDSAFILRLVNDPSWIEFIGDRGIRTLEDASRYIKNGAEAMYKKYGFGLFLTELMETGKPIGICGLVKRDGLEDVDIGFAFMPEYWGQGYAYEAAASVLQYAKETLKLERVAAITTHHNESSMQLIERLGLTFEKNIKMPNDQEELKLFAKRL